MSAMALATATIKAQQFKSGQSPQKWARASSCRNYKVSARCPANSRLRGLVTEHGAPDDILRPAKLVIQGTDHLPREFAADIEPPTSPLTKKFMPGGKLVTQSQPTRGSNQL